MIARQKLFNYCLLVLLLGGVVFGFSLIDLPEAAAQTPTQATLNGYAWSSNIGWIKMKSDSSDTRSYGVSLNNGVFNGYAWSPHVGWLKFDSALTGASGSGSGARLSGNSVVGWARFCSALGMSCSGTWASNEKNGGWDGWLLLGGNNLPGGGLSVTNGNRLTGYAWGSENIGWVDFSGVTLTEGFIVDCSVSPTSVLPGGSAAWNASVSGNTGSPTYSWVFSDGRTSTLQNPTYTYPTLGTITGTVTVTDGGNSRTSVCQTQLTVTNTLPTGPFKVTIRIVGSGAVWRLIPTSNLSGIWNCYNTDPAITKECVDPLNYQAGTAVRYGARINSPTIPFIEWQDIDNPPWDDIINYGIITDYTADLTMDRDRTITAVFEQEPIVQKFEISSVGYAGGQGSMRVNYQTQELDAPHDSSKATITFRRLDPSWVGTINLAMPITALLNKETDEGSDAPSAVLPPIVMDSDEETVEIYLSFPDDGRTEQGIVSPYAGNYTFTLKASADGSLDDTELIKFGYIDLREAEQ